MMLLTLVDGYVKKTYDTNLDLRHLVPRIRGRIRGTVAPRLEHDTHQRLYKNYQKTLKDKKTILKPLEMSPYNLRPRK